jgi:hypothetical protein
VTDRAPNVIGISSTGVGCGRINMRSFLSSPLVVVGKGLKLTRNRSVGHGLGSAEQSPLGSIVAIRRCSSIIRR